MSGCGVICRNCRWIGHAETGEEACAIEAAHECVGTVAGAQHETETGYTDEGCRCGRCRAAHAAAERGRKRGEGLGHRRGERHHWSKLTEADVVEIRRLLTAGVTKAAIATRFGVTEANIKHVAAGRTWRHVSSPFDA